MQARFFYNFWAFITLFGNPIFYILVILFFLKADFAVALRLLIIFITMEVICWSIKLFYKKERPLARLRTTFIKNIDANSFPSIHTARISALVAPLGLFYKNELVFVIGALLIFGVGYSRIYLRHHYFNDVVAGSLIGVVASLAALYF